MVSKSCVPIEASVLLLIMELKKKSNHDSYTILLPANVVVKFILKVDKGSIVLGCKGNIAQDGTDDIRSNLLSLKPLLKTCIRVKT